MDDEGTTNGKNKRPRTRTIAPEWFDGRTWYSNRQEDEAPGAIDVLHYTDVIGPVDTLQSCLLTCMCIDPAFLFPLFTTAGRPLDMTIVHDGSQFRRDIKKDDVVRIRSSTMPHLNSSLPEGHEWMWITHYQKMGLQHGKLMLLRRERSLRVVVTSANLNREWDLSREVIWCQDFPVVNKRFQNGMVIEDQSQFYLDLKELCDKLSVDVETFYKLTIGVDFSGAKATLVASVRGTHHDPDKYKWGHFKLRKVLNGYPWPRGEHEARTAPVYVQTGSMGNLNIDWLREMGLSLTVNSRRTREDPGPPPHLKGFPNLRILWPRTETAFQSNQNFLDSINLNKVYWDGEGFPRHLFYAQEPRWTSSTIAPPMAHAKFLLRVVPPGLEEEGKITAWIYVGSHNFSRAAWGSMTTSDGRAFRMSNTEIGVVLTTTSPEERDRWLAKAPLRLPIDDMSIQELQYKDDWEPYVDGAEFHKDVGGRRGRDMYMERRKKWLRMVKGEVEEEEEESKTSAILSYSQVVRFDDDDDEMEEMDGVSGYHDGSEGDDGQQEVEDDVEVVDVVEERVVEEERDEFYLE